MQLKYGMEKRMKLGKSEQMLPLINSWKLPPMRRGSAELAASGTSSCLSRWGPRASTVLRACQLRPRCRARYLTATAGTPLKWKYPDTANGFFFCSEQNNKRHCYWTSNRLASVKLRFSLILDNPFYEY